VEEEIKKAFPDADVLAMPSMASGIFNIEVDDEVIYSKEKEGNFPQIDELLTRIKSHTKKS
jgi:selT/selW/selH-like putative selenoprotein